MRKIPVFWNSAMVPGIPGAYSRMDAAAALVASLRSQVHVSVVPSRAATVAELYAAHDFDFVRNILAERMDNGDGNRDPAAVAALMWEVGCVLSAADHVVGKGRRDIVAMAATGPMGHASYAATAPGCTFNGLMVAAMSMLSADRARRVGILDFGPWGGQGVWSIMVELGLHGLVRYVSCDVSKDCTPIRAVRDFAGWDLLLCQAPVSLEDTEVPAGGDQAQRVRDVFWMCAEYRIPLVWTPALNPLGKVSHHQAKALQQHEEAMRNCVAIYVGGEDRRPRAVSD